MQGSSGNLRCSAANCAAAMSNFPVCTARRGLVLADPFAIRIALAKRLEHRNRRMSSFNNEVADQAEFVTLRSTCGVAGNANPGANRLVEPFEARAGIEHVSQGGIFEAAWPADIADQAS